MPQYFIKTSSGENGPVAESEVRARAATGKLQPTDQVRDQNSETWRLAREIRGYIPPAAVTVSDRHEEPAVHGMPEPESNNRRSRTWIVCVALGLTAVTSVFVFSVVKMLPSASPAAVDSSSGHATPTAAIATIPSAESTTLQADSRRPDSIDIAGQTQPPVSQVVQPAQDLWPTELANIWDRLAWIDGPPTFDNIDRFVRLISTRAVDKSGPKTTKEQQNFVPLATKSELLASAARGDALALHMLGLAAALGVPMARRNLGGMYLYEFEGTTFYNPKVAVALLEPFGDNARAAQWLGKAYLTDALRDGPEAARWYSVAANLGDVPSMYNVARLYQDGEFVPTDHAEAFRWYLRGAENNDADCQVAVAGYLLTGNGGVRVDLARATHWVELAVKQDHPEAMGILAFMLDEDVFGKRDLSRAVKLATRAAAQNSVFGRSKLAYFMREGRGIREDDAAALRLYEELAREGDPEAMGQVAYMLHRGEGAPVDNARAFALARRAVDLGYDESRTTLACMYYNGDGIERDYKEAARQARWGVRNNNPDAQFLMALLYGKGKGVPQNSAECRRLLNLAAKQGHKPARDVLKRAADISTIRAIEVVADLTVGLSSGLSTGRSRPSEELWVNPHTGDEMWITPTLLHMRPAPPYERVK